VLRGSDIRLAADERERMEINADYQQVRARMLRLIASVDRGDLSISVNIRGGDPVEAIAGSVQDYEADLLVIGARDRNALSRLVLGSTAYKVLTTIKCPIIVTQEAEAKSKRHSKGKTGENPMPA
jgi:nucleotide-binding universal stress UspA family protein